ncbi:MAG TPA: pyridoxal phosphate-dependent aminotransferase family protein [Bacteroidia bacterium]
MNEDFLYNRLEDRKEKKLFRELSYQNELVDFSSNDYLGFAKSQELFEHTRKELAGYCSRFLNRNGSTGSRLLTGNSLYIEETEQLIADYHEAEAGLIFNSGYSANTGLLSCISQKTDFIFYDELSHASIYDGMRLSRSSTFPFRHNDLNHLEERLRYFRDYQSGGSCFVVAESVYSMDGDFAPLVEMAGLCERFDANLIVDEAHATGIFGANGEGRVVESDIQSKIFARIHTFGKALGCHGAIVLGSKKLRDYLINFSRPFIYTTALPVHSIASIKMAYELLERSQMSLVKIRELSLLFENMAKKNNVGGFLESSSPIQSFVLAGNEKVRQLALAVQKDGFDVRPILSPTVPAGKERIRICLHAFNTENEIQDVMVSIRMNSKLISEKQIVVN